ncbi:hypothetical protein MY4824_007775 [Beauveria thailandica]
MSVSCSTGKNSLQTVHQRKSQELSRQAKAIKKVPKSEVSQLKGSSGCADVEMPDYTAFQLIPADDVEKFTQDQINPQINFPKYMIQDVYLATHLQQCFLRDVYGRPKPLVPFYVEFPPDSRSFRVQAVLQRKKEERNVIQHPGGS